MNDVIALPIIKKEDSVAEIQRLAKQESEKIFFLDHAHLRMQERNILSRQVIKTLAYGQAINGPSWCTKHDERGWKCTFYRVVAGDPITVAAKLTERNGVCCLVITAF